MPNAIRFILFLGCVFSGIFFPAFIFASSPVDGCRVKTTVLQKHGALVNSAGCVVTRSVNGHLEFLQVLVNKGPGARGWGFPGGHSATRAQDLKSDDTKAFASSVSFDYAEPAVCTAARETREEVGLEVIVGEPIDISDKFIAFECSAADVKKLQGVLLTKDEGEIKDIRWIDLDWMRRRKFFPS